MQITEVMPRWASLGGSEMPTAQYFAIDLTDLPDVLRPNVSDKDSDSFEYRFERPVFETHTGRKKTAASTFTKEIASFSKQSSSSGPRHRITTRLRCF